MARNYARKPDQYLIGLRKHFRLVRRGKEDKRGAAINECWKPSNEASKADLKEFHREELKLRRSRYHRGEA